jgi:hypothetical protein
VVVNSSLVQWEGALDCSMPDKTKKRRDVKLFILTDVRRFFGACVAPKRQKFFRSRDSWLKYFVPDFSLERERLLMTQLLDMQVHTSLSRKKHQLSRLSVFFYLDTT